MGKLAEPGCGERTYNDGQWTRGRFDSFITSLLRSGSRKWPPKYRCLNDAKTEKKINAKTGRLAQHFKCAHCLQDYPAKDVEVDHNIPIGKGRTWDEFIDGLFCEQTNLQVLCKPCHKIKTLKERNENLASSSPAKRKRKV